MKNTIIKKLVKTLIIIFSVCRFSYSQIKIATIFSADLDTFKENYSGVKKYLEEKKVAVKFSEYSLAQQD